MLFLPFAIETVLFGFLFVLNQKAEEIASEERLRTNFMQGISALMEESGMAWADILNRLSSTNAKNALPVSPQEYRLNTAKQIKQLEAIPLHSDKLSLILNKVRDLRDVQADTLDAIGENTESFSDLEKLEQLKRRYSYLRKNLYISKAKLAEVNRLVVTEQTSMDAAVAAERFQRELVKKLLLVGFVVQALITVLLLILFVNNITRRLDSLVRNARILPTGAALREHVAGGDEIAYLDNVLHDASKSLAQEAQNRQSIMNMIAHDIRSPLTSSYLLLEKLTDELESAAVGQATTKRLQNTFRQLSILVEDLLTIEKLESGKLELTLGMFNIQSLAEQSIETLRPQSNKKNIEIHNLIPSSIEAVVDSGRILQVLNNLISNAIKYSAPGDTIEIDAKPTSQSVTISVRDNGKGISEKDLPSVFERFFQASDDTARQGFGLGLAICKLIITTHGGRIGAESVLNEGSTFWFTLPVDE